MSTQEATLQCIDAIKNRSRAGSAKSAEAAASTISPSHFRPQKRVSKNKLYDIEVVEENGSQVKVHYCGYGPEYDEWKPRSEVVYTKPSFSPSNQQYSPITDLACAIKKHLQPSRSEDPEVRIQVPCDDESFQALREVGVIRSEGRGAEKYGINDYHDLDEILGENWYLRIVNSAGDFSYAILATISFHLSKARPILEYEVVKKTDNTLDFLPTYIEQSNSLVFKFVRGDGNKKKLMDFI